MNIILTGATGFVGHNLLSIFDNGELILTPFSLRKDWLQNVPTNYSGIIHLAGKAHDTNNSSCHEEYFDVNVELTKQLFDQFLESDARDFIYFSSVKAVADSVAGLLSEDAVPNPQTPYGQSKWQAEQYLNNRPLPSGKRLFILRPCMIHGPGNKGNLNLLFHLVNKGLPWPLASFENKRSFLSIDNLGYIIGRILKDPNIPGGTYNLADDEMLTTNELIKLIGEARNKKPWFWKVPPLIVRRVANLGDILCLPLNNERLKKLTDNYMVDNSKIKSVLSISKLPISAREGLLKTLRSF